MIIKKGLSKMFVLLLTIGLLFAITGCTNPTDDDNSIPVTAITILAPSGATTITAHRGTLQLSTLITPVTATNKTVTWSVINGTGSASITSSGLLTALSNGTITAKVVSRSVTTISAKSSSPSVTKSQTIQCL